METLRDKVRAACHYLKMHPLTMVNASSVKDIRTRIAKLPSPETIAGMDKKELWPLKNTVEKIIFDIDNARDSRTNSFAVHNMIDKGLPPYRSPILANSWYGKAILKEACDTDNKAV